MHFSGLGSMMQPHFRNGPIVRPYSATAKEEALRELYFFDLLAAGIDNHRPFSGEIDRGSSIRFDANLQLNGRGIDRDLAEPFLHFRSH